MPEINTLAYFILPLATKNKKYFERTAPVSFLASTQHSQKQDTFTEGKAQYN
jgi:hypothetical protein